MADFSYSQNHPVDEHLRNVAFGAVNSQDFLFRRVLEPVRVEARSGTITIENARTFMGDPSVSGERAPGAARARIQSKAPSTDTFLCGIYGYEDSIPMQDLRDWSHPGDLEDRQMEILANVAAIKRELRLKDALFNGSNFNTVACASITNGSGAKFSAAGGEPISDLSLIRDEARANAHGIMPDTLILGYDVVSAISRNAEARGFLGDTSAGLASGSRVMMLSEVPQMLSNILGIPNVYVGASRYEGVRQGGTSAEVDVWADGVWMGNLRGGNPIASGNRVRVSAVGLADFVYEEDNAGRYDTPDMVARNIWLEHIHQYKVLDSNQGYYISDCV